MTPRSFPTQHGSNILPDLGQVWPTLDRTGAHLDQPRPMWANVWPTWSNFDQHRPRLVELVDDLVHPLIKVCIRGYLFSFADEPKKASATDSRSAQFLDSPLSGFSDFGILVFCPGFPISDFYISRCLVVSGFPVFWLCPFFLDFWFSRVLHFPISRFWNVGCLTFPISGCPDFSMPRFQDSPMPVHFRIPRCVAFSVPEFPHFWISRLLDFRIPRSPDSEFPELMFSRFLDSRFLDFPISAFLDSRFQDFSVSGFPKS